MRGCARAAGRRLANSVRRVVNNRRSFLATPTCPEGHGKMNRENFHWFRDIAISVVLEVLFWIVIFLAYLFFSSLHAQSLIWVFGAVVLVAIALASEWWVVSYRCTVCGETLTRSDCAQQASREHG